MRSPHPADHPTHNFHGTDDGYLCHACDARPGRAAGPCPAYADEARAALVTIARLLVRSLPPAPAAPPADAPMSEHHEHGFELAAWQTDLNVREAACRSLGRMLGLDVDSDATLPAMAQP